MDEVLISEVQQGLFIIATLVALVIVLGAAYLVIVAFITIREQLSKLGYAIRMFFYKRKG